MTGLDHLKLKTTQSNFVTVSTCFNQQYKIKLILFKKTETSKMVKQRSAAGAWSADLLHYTLSYKFNDYLLFL